MTRSRPQLRRGALALAALALSLAIAARIENLTKKTP